LKQTPLKGIEVNKFRIAAASFMLGVPFAGVLVMAPQAAADGECGNVSTQQVSQAQLNSPQCRACRAAAGIDPAAMGRCDGVNINHRPQSPFQDCNALPTLMEQQQCSDRRLAGQ
jgi:hypothetical protein